MTECKHHWHVFTRHDHSGGQTIVRKCCHCGCVEHEHVPPANDAIWTGDTSECGPMVDPYRVGW